MFEPFDNADWPVDLLGHSNLKVGNDKQNRVVIYVDGDDNYNDLQLTIHSNEARGLAALLIRKADIVDAQREKERAAA